MCDRAVRYKKGGRSTRERDHYSIIPDELGVLTRRVGFGLLHRIRSYYKENPATVTLTIRPTESKTTPLRSSNKGESFPVFIVKPYY